MFPVAVSSATGFCFWLVCQFSIIFGSMKKINPKKVAKYLNYYIHLLFGAAIGDKKARHSEYDRALRLERLYKILDATPTETGVKASYYIDGGDNIERYDKMIDVLPLAVHQKILLRYFMRECDKKEFICAISPLITGTKSLINGAVGSFKNTVEKAKPKVDEFDLLSGTDEEMERVNESIKHYAGNKDLQEFMRSVYPVRASKRFNSYHVTDFWDSEVVKKVVEASSVINLHCIDGDFAMLLTRELFDYIKSPSEIEKAASYHLYLPRFTLRLHPVSKIPEGESALPYSNQIDFATIVSNMQRTEQARSTQKLLDINGQAFVAYDQPTEEQIAENVLYFKASKEKEKKTLYFKLQMSYHGLGFVPATSFGYQMDDATNGKLNASNLDDGIEEVMKVMDRGKVYGEAMASSVYPREALIELECEGEDDDGCKGSGCSCKGSKGDECDYCGGDWRPCGRCEGKGFLYPRTSRQKIIFRLSNKEVAEMEGIPDMSKMIATFPVDLDTVRYLKEDLESAKLDFHKAIFHSTVFHTSKSANTATEVVGDINAAYGVIARLENHICQSLELHRAAILGYYGIENYVNRFVPSDSASLRPLDEKAALELLGIAQSSAGSMSVIAQLNYRIACQVFKDNEKGLKVEKILRLCDPFYGLSMDQRAAKMNNPNILEIDKVASCYLLQIIKENEPVLNLVGDDARLKARITELVKEKYELVRAEGKSDMREVMRDMFEEIDSVEDDEVGDFVDIEE